MHYKLSIVDVLRDAAPYINEERGRRLTLVEQCRRRWLRGAAESLHSVDYNGKYEDKERRNEMNNRTRYLLLLLLAVLDTHVKAQWNFDIPVVEAYINDHKQQRSLLLARSTLELSNQLLHEYSSDAAVGYKELNIDFDKYTRAFDVIDVLYQSLRTSLNVYSTYNTVSDRIGDYKNLLGDYRKRCWNGEKSLRPTPCLSA